MTPIFKKVFAWIAGILGGVIAGLLVYELTRPGPAETPPAPAPPIYSGGTSQVLFRGVNIPPPQPGVSGPVLFRNISLDEGAETGAPPHDVSLEIDAGDLSVTYSFRRAVDAGTVPISYEKCLSLLASPDEPLRLQSAEFPTRYACVETREGRASLFRITRINLAPVFVVGGGNESYDLTLEFEYTTWDRQ